MNPGDPALKKGLQVGKTRLANNVLAAPMCGLTVSPFRYLSKRFGAGLVCTEMTSSDALVRVPARTLKRLAFTEEERPVAIQICGSEPSIVGKAVSVLAKLQPDVIDLNLGCPVPKVAGKMSGSGLLKDPDRAVRIADAAVGAAGDIPVTAKFRLGWDEKSLTYDIVGPRYEAAGIKLISVHARTRSMKFSGPPMWEHVARLKSLIKIPVIANGEITSGLKAVEVMKLTGADGVMLGRGAVSNPWLFEEVLAAFEGRSYSRPSPIQKILLLRELRDRVIQFFDPVMGVPFSRAYAGPLISGMPGAREARGLYMTARTVEEQDRVFDALLEKFGNFPSPSPLPKGEGTSLEEEFVMAGAAG